MIRSDLRTLFYSKIHESTNNSGVPVAFLNLLFDEACRVIAKHNNIEWESLRDETTLVNPYTTVAAGGATGTTLNVTSVSNMSSGQFVHITDDTIYEKVKLTGTGTLTSPITLASPGLVNTYDAGDKVIGNQVVLSGVHKIYDVVAEKITSTEQTTVRLFRTEEELLDLDSPRILAVGTPTYYTYNNGTISFYPLPDAAWKFKVKYLKTPTMMTADTDEPWLPAEYHHLVIEYALGQAWMNEGDAGKRQTALMHLQAFQQGLRQMAWENVYSPDADYRFRLEDEL